VKLRSFAEKSALTVENDRERFFIFRTLLEDPRQAFKTSEIRSDAHLAIAS
jgi:hypothetical protein